MVQATRLTQETPEGSGRDRLNELLREGARQLLEEAVEAELAEFLAGVREQRLKDGRQRIGAQRLLAGAGDSNGLRGRLRPDPESPRSDQRGREV